jgi:hypothetical protein
LLVYSTVQIIWRLLCQLFLQYVRLRIEYLCLYKVQVF